MPNENDQTVSDQTGDQSSSEAGDQSSFDPAAELESLRKRQSGADKARDIAIAERDRLAAELAALKTGKPAGKSEGGSDVDVEALKQELRKEFSEQTAKAVEAERLKGLQRLYPNATKRFPGLADEAQLAELEEVFGDRPKPVGNNASRDQKPKSDEDMTAAELAASIKGMDTSNLW